MSGWIKLYRKLLDSNIWIEKPFSRGQAWVDLIMLANHKPGYVRVAGTRVDLKRGDVGWSQVKLCERWGWSRGKVRRFLDELETDGNIVQTTVQRFSVITICNYSQYQDRDTTDGTDDNTPDGQETDRRRYNNKNEKNNKNNIYDDKFEEFWKAYPKNNGAKKTAFTAYKTARKKTDHQTIMNGASLYRDYAVENKTDIKYIAHASTWLNGERWDITYSGGKPEENGAALAKQKDLSKDDWDNMSDFMKNHYRHHRPEIARKYDQ